jgi:hypothetical protein
MTEYYDEIKLKKNLDYDVYGNSLKDIVRVENIIQKIHPNIKAKSFK